jgi:hypothetical protein
VTLIICVAILMWLSFRIGRWDAKQDRVLGQLAEMDRVRDRLRATRTEAKHAAEQHDFARAGALLDRASALEQALDGATERDSPTLLEDSALMYFTLAGRAKEYREILRLRYPKWTPRQPGTTTRASFDGAT